MGGWVDEVGDINSGADRIIGLSVVREGESGELPDADITRAQLVFKTKQIVTKPTEPRHEQASQQRSK